LVISQYYYYIFVIYYDTLYSMVKTTGPQTKEVIELSTLLEISQTINSSTNIQQNLYAILDILAQN